jgi:hypothetical protein
MPSRKLFTNPAGIWLVGGAEVLFTMLQDRIDEHSAESAGRA